MRKAAGILMILHGALSLFVFVFLLIGFNVEFGSAFDILRMISVAFIVTGGVFCLERTYWKLCFASSLVLLLFLLFELVFIFPYAFGLSTFDLPQNVGMAISLTWGILPLIFVCLRKSDWNIYSRIDFKARMRQAAGISLMIIGALLLVGFAIPLIQYGIVLFDSVLAIFLMICGAFLITGGVFCLKKKYWRLCLASVWLAISIIITGFMWFMFMWLTGHFQLPLQDSPWTWLALIFSILGTLSIIFVYLTKKEWKEIQG